jgi:hypothetical protein
MEVDITGNGWIWYHVYQTNILAWYQWCLLEIKGGKATLYREMQWKKKVEVQGANHA